jgi:hypothetical protein
MKRRRNGITKAVGWTVIGLVIALVLLLMGVLAGWIWPVGLLTVGILLVLNVYYVFAPRGWFVTIVPEGKAKAVMRMEGFEKFLIQWKGYTFDYSKDGDDKWTVIEGKERHLFGGLRWVGIPPFWSIYKYEFSWIGVDVNGNPIPHVKEILDHIPLKEDVYAAEVAEAEDRELLPLSLWLLETMWVINPYKALFRVENWSEMIINRIRPLGRDYITSSPFKDLITMLPAIGQEVHTRIEASGGLGEEFKERYGVEVRKSEVRQINPPPGYREATLKEWAAKREKERILVEAEAEKQRIATVYGAVREMGDVGKLIRTLEMFEKSPEKGTRWVINLPGGISDILSQAFPGRTIGVPTPEGGIRVTPEELKALREELGRMELQVEAYAKQMEGEARKAGIITS